ncbi:hydrogenase nickel incorporation protein HypA [Legionella norrlandica]|uniref:Hydrogenase maturation factor HypA n=1 Tax=Legionella norrlandica TaxID=1498499 RepID=A0A0A2SQD2_9GAMM|nr:hydrogenase maturation nickel metallochaperone HypA [Legionella norrlandica]KGP63345.1 hydrogenase nickel incorporation protein HypA [Legionella norrlandica]
MHELWLCRSLLAIIEEQANKRKCQKVKKIILEAGQLAAIDKDALNFSFSVITQGTIAQNAELLFIEIPGEAKCHSCEQVVPVKQYYEGCQACGHHSLTLTQGSEELKIKSMVVE